MRYGINSTTNTVQTPPPTAQSRMLNHWLKFKQKLWQQPDTGIEGKSTQHKAACNSEQPGDSLGPTAGLIHSVPGYGCVLTAAITFWSCLLITKAVTICGVSSCQKLNQKSVGPLAAFLMDDYFKWTRNKTTILPKILSSTLNKWLAWVPDRALCAALFSTVFQGWHYWHFIQQQRNGHF